MNELDGHILELRSEYLQQIRSYFRSHSFLEVETPTLNRWSTPEPFLHPFFVRSSQPGAREVNAAPDSSTEFESDIWPALITSPEFNLKIIWSRLQRNIFEIAHCFRSGEYGSLHSSEFLMLEWYDNSRDEFQSIQFIYELIQSLLESCKSLRNTRIDEPGSLEQESGGSSADESGFVQTWIPALKVISVDELFRGILGTGLTEHELRNGCLNRGHFAADTTELFRNRNYEEFFFTLFLNYIEPTFSVNDITAVYGFPEPLSAYAQLRNGIARRFEVFWKGLELANGYFELQDATEQRNRMIAEAKLKKELTGTAPVLPEQFLKRMEYGLPSGTGVALGLERLLMALTDCKAIQDISPFPSAPDEPG